MSSQWFLYSYLVAGLAAIFLLIVFRAQHWYLHSISILAGLLAGIVPPVGGIRGDWFYLAAGVACVFLLTWGLGRPFFARRPKMVIPTQSMTRGSKRERAALV